MDKFFFNGEGNREVVDDPDDPFAEQRENIVVMRWVIWFALGLIVMAFAMG